MNYHDYLLDAYKVSEAGRTIELEFSNTNSSTHRPKLKFTEVALYHFIHTQGTIILDIEEVHLAALLNRYEQQIAEWNRWYGVTHWKADFPQYQKTLKELNFKAWVISSSIGFYGFIVARKSESI